jgi:hypothetical protein
MNALFCVRVREYSNGGCRKQLRHNFSVEKSKVARFRQFGPESNGPKPTAQKQHPNSNGNKCLV